MTGKQWQTMYTAARTCYSAKTPEDIFHESEIRRLTEENEDKEHKLVGQVLGSGHSSIAEHICFTFAISGISRACSHQLVRHRAGIVFSQQSQRYVEIKENVNTIQNMIAFPASSKELAMTLLSKYFVDVNDNNYLIYLKCLQNYLSQTELGVKAEDARNVLPNATKTNITVTVNLRELIHISNLRLCTRAQKEIRTLFNLIKKEVTAFDKDLGDMLVPSCVANHGICFEHKCCGRCPHIDEVMAVYNAFKDDFISKEDYEKLVVKNPKVNEKLKALLEMPNVLE